MNVPVISIDIFGLERCGVRTVSNGMCKLADEMARSDLFLLAVISM